MAGKPVRIAILADSRDGVRGFNAVGDAGERAGKKIEQGATRAQRAGKVINAGAKIAALGFAAAGVGAFKLAQGAAEDEKASAALAKTLKNTAGATASQVAATEDWITAQGKALGVADDELRPALGALATATGDVGKAQKLTALAMNISAGTGKSLETVTNALVRAQNGSVGGLSRLGIATKDASGKTKTFTQLQGELAQKFKGQAATAAGTAEGKIGRFKLAVSEAGESIGYMLIPFLTSLATWLNDKVVPAFDTTFAWMDSHQTTVKVLAAGIGALGAAFILGSVAMKAYTLYTKAATIAQKAANLAMRANPIGLVITALLALGAALVFAYKKSETFRNIVNGALNGVKNAAATALGWVKAHWPLLLGILTGPFGIAAVTIVRHWDKITGGAKKMWDYVSGLPGKIKGAFSGIWNGLAGGLKSAINNVLHLPLKIPKINTKIPGVGTVGGQTLIPALANGGIVTRPTLALIGEAGPEAVIPLSRAAAPALQRPDPFNVRLLEALEAIREVLVDDARGTSRRHRELVGAVKSSAVAAGAEFGHQLNKSAGRARATRRTN